MHIFSVLALGLFPMDAEAAKNPFRVEAPSVETLVSEEGLVKVTVVVPRGFHVYRDMMHLKVIDGSGLSFSDPVFPQGVFQPDPADPEGFREQYDESVEITASFVSQKVGSFSPLFEVRYQGCKASLCYMPKTEDVSVDVRVNEPPKEKGDPKKK
jgi:thiol:disulfide interchange protein